ncbi:uncharacterized protein [Watersipora subatra]|uniref:uncharacterized protein n=1 Tax=Watersipora subatra TaxID=2589382 RepID=UPI00355C9781
MNNSSNGMMNGGLPQPTPTPTPIPPSSHNLDTTALQPPAAKTVRWTASNKEIVEIQKKSLSLGLNGGVSLTNGYTHQSLTTDSAGVKFISLASPLSNGVDTKLTALPELKYDESTSSMVQRSLPMRATLHKQKQIPGRFFPSPSYTEFQRDVLESRPTPRRIIRKFKPKNGTNNSQLFPAGSPVKPRTACDKSTWIANHVYSRGSQGVGSLEKGPVLPPDIDVTLNASRQYSIPATTIFHDGNNDALITGLSKTLHSKDSVPSDGAALN